MTPISSWGRLSADRHQVVALSDPSSAHQIIRNTPQLGLAHGMGRSYGDECLNPQGSLWLTAGLNHFIRFDRHSGRLLCEAGVLLRDIQRMAIAQGWILPVTPGTQMVTVGGAIANDVHGKNHHALGSFGDHIIGLKLLRTDGEIIDCGPNENPEWFAATVGGMGLTGVIAQAEIQLRPANGPWLDTETIPFEVLDEFFQLSDDSEADWEHTVSWIDCLSPNGRGLFMRANPAAGDRLPAPEPKNRALTMPLVPLVSLVNRLTLKPFNWAYYKLKAAKAGLATAHYESFFYPLDNLHQWNRMYGPKGFYQYQSVVPTVGGKEAVAAMLEAIAQSGQGSFLAVLKTFGERDALGMMSFPQPGVTLALDFPNQGARTEQLLQRLDAIVREAKGRIYAAKDARMPKDLFESGYPRLSEFLTYRDKGISSALSRRLIGS